MCVCIYIHILPCLLLHKLVVRYVINFADKVVPEGTEDQSYGKESLAKK